MLIYFAAFSAFAICAGWLVASVYEWRQAMLYGRYVSQDRIPGRATIETRPSRSRRLTRSDGKRASAEAIKRQVEFVW
jgi:hypothetical protein